MDNKPVDFSVVKQKIIKTDELLQMYLETNNKLKKVVQACRELKSNFDQSQLEKDRCVYSLESLKDKYKCLDSQYKELSQQKASLEDKYNQQTLVNQINIKELEDELQMSKELQKASQSIKSPKKNKNSVEIKKIEELEQRLQKQKELECTYKKESNKLQQENLSLLEQMSIDKNEHKRVVECLQNEKHKTLQDLHQIQFKLNETKNQHAQLRFEKDKEIFELRAELAKTKLFKQRINQLEHENKQLTKNVLTEGKLFPQNKLEKDFLKNCSVAVQTEQIYLSEEEKNKLDLSADLTALESDISVSKMLKEMIEIPVLLSPLRSCSPFILDDIPTNQTCNPPDIILTRSNQVEENVNLSKENCIASIFPNETIPEIITPQPITVEMNNFSSTANTTEEIRKSKNPRFLKRFKLFNRQKVLRKKKYFIKLKNKLKCQDSVVRALQILKRSKINFTISNESSFPIHSRDYNLLRDCCGIQPDMFVSEPCNNLSNVECLNCRSKNCKNMFMLLKNNGDNERLLGFFNVKKEKISPTPSRTDVKNEKTESPLLWLKNHVTSEVTSENVLEKLAELVSEKIQKKSRDWHLPLDSSEYHSETETELQHLFETPDVDTPNDDEFLISNVNLDNSKCQDTNQQGVFCPLQNSVLHHWTNANFNHATTPDIPTTLTTPVDEVLRENCTNNYELTNSAVRILSSHVIYPSSLNDNAQENETSSEAILPISANEVTLNPLTNRVPNKSVLDKFEKMELSDKPPLILTNPATQEKLNFPEIDKKVTCCDPNNDPTIQDIDVIPLSPFTSINNEELSEIVPENCEMFYSQETSNEKMDHIEDNAEFNSKDCQDAIDYIEDNTELNTKESQDEIDYIEDNTELNTKDCQDAIDYIEDNTELNTKDCQDDIDYIEDNTELNTKDCQDAIDYIKDNTELNTKDCQDDIDYIEDNTELNTKDCQDDIDYIEDNTQLNTKDCQDNIDYIEDNTELNTKDCQDDIESKSLGNFSHPPVFLVKTNEVLENKASETTQLDTASENENNILVFSPKHQSPRDIDNSNIFVGLTLENANNPNDCELFATHNSLINSEQLKPHEPESKDSIEVEIKDAQNLNEEGIYISQKNVLTASDVLLLQSVDTQRVEFRSPKNMNNVSDTDDERKNELSPSSILKYFQPPPLLLSPLSSARGTRSKPATLKTYERKRTANQIKCNINNRFKNLNISKYLLTSEKIDLEIPSAPSYLNTLFSDAFTPANDSFLTEFKHSKSYSYLKINPPSDQRHTMKEAVILKSCLEANDLSSKIIEDDFLNFLPKHSDKESDNNILGSQIHKTTTSSPESLTNCPASKVSISSELASSKPDTFLPDTPASPTSPQTQNLTSTVACYPTSPVPYCFETLNFCVSPFPKIIPLEKKEGSSTTELVNLKMNGEACKNVKFERKAVESCSSELKDIESGTFVELKIPISAPSPDLSCSLTPKSNQFASTVQVFNIPSEIDRLKYSTSNVPVCPASPVFNCPGSPDSYSELEEDKTFPVIIPLEKIEAENLVTGSSSCQIQIGPSMDHEEQDSINTSPQKCDKLERETWFAVKQQSNANKITEDIIAALNIPVDNSTNQLTNPLSVLTLFNHSHTVSLERDYTQLVSPIYPASPIPSFPGSPDSETGLEVEDNFPKIIPLEKIEGVHMAAESSEKNTDKTESEQSEVSNNVIKYEAASNKIKGGRTTTRHLNLSITLDHSMNDPAANSNKQNFNNILNPVQASTLNSPSYSSPEQNKSTSSIFCLNPPLSNNSTSSPVQTSVSTEYDCFTSSIFNCPSSPDHCNGPENEDNFTTLEKIKNEIFTELHDSKIVKIIPEDVNKSFDLMEKKIANTSLIDFEDSESEASSKFKKQTPPTSDTFKDNVKHLNLNLSITDVDMSMNETSQNFKKQCNVSTSEISSTFNCKNSKNYLEPRIPRIDVSPTPSLPESKLNRSDLSGHSCPSPTLDRLVSLEHASNLDSPLYPDQALNHLNSPVNNCSIISLDVVGDVAEDKKIGNERNFTTENSVKSDSASDCTHLMTEDINLEATTSNCLDSSKAKSCDEKLDRLIHKTSGNVLKKRETSKISIPSRSDLEDTEFESNKNAIKKVTQQSRLMPIDTAEIDQNKNKKILRSSNKNSLVAPIVKRNVGRSSETWKGSLSDSPPSCEVINSVTKRKKVGRLKKSRELLSTSESDSSLPEEPGTVVDSMKGVLEVIKPPEFVKKGRGRPRKYPKTDFDAAPINNINKNNGDEVLASESDCSLPEEIGTVVDSMISVLEVIKPPKVVKRGRGRPRKYAKTDFESAPINNVNKNNRDEALANVFDSNETENGLLEKEVEEKCDGKPNDVAKQHKPVKRMTKLQSKVMRQMKEKQKMLQCYQFNNANCDVKVKEKEVTVVLNTSQNAKANESVTNKLSKKINIVQNILIPPDASKPIDLLDSNCSIDSRDSSQIKSPSAGARKRPAPAKNDDCDILSKIMTDMDKERPQEPVKTTVIKNDTPTSLDEKQWRKNILDIAEVIHNKDIDMKDIYGDHTYKRKRQGFLRNGAVLPEKLNFLLNKLLQIPNEDDIPQEIMVEFKRLSAESIIDLVIYQMSRDFHEKLDNKYYPAPLMTRTQRIFLGLLVKLESDKSFENIVNRFLFRTQQHIFKIGCGIRAAIPLTRLYLSICRLYANIHRMRTFCCEAFFYAEDLAIPILFAVLTSWTEVIPLESEVKNYPIAKVIVQIVHLKTCSAAGYNLFPLKCLLSQYHGYPKERRNCDELFEEVYQDYLANPALPTDYAIRLFCRNKDTQWVYKKLNEFFKPLIYKIPQVNTNFKASSIILMGKICRQFKPKKAHDNKYLLELTRWFEGLLEDNEDSIVQQSIKYTIEHLPMKGKKHGNFYENVVTNLTLPANETKTEL